MAPRPLGSTRANSRSAISFRYPSYSSTRQQTAHDSQLAGPSAHSSGSSTDEADDVESASAGSDPEEAHKPFLSSPSKSPAVVRGKKGKRIRMGRLDSTEPSSAMTKAENGELEGAAVDHGGLGPHSRPAPTQRRSSMRPPSLDDLFDASKTAAENKTLLVSAELDRMGMGRYQWLIFGLCGLGYFVDLLWAQGWGLIATPIKNEFAGVNNANIGLLNTAFNIGLTVGAFVWGFLVDLIGRKYSFYLTCLTASVFGIGSGGASTYAGLCALSAFVGFGVGGNIPIDTLITLEFLPTNRRFLLSLLSVFQPIGVLVCCGIAYGFIPSYSCGLSPDGVPTTVTDCPRSENEGWRYTLYTLGSLTLAAFLARFLIFKFHESPAFLISKGRDDQAVAVVRKIARFNGAPEPHFGIDHFREVDRRIGTLPASKRDLVEEDGGLVKRWTAALLGGVLNAGRLFATPTAARCTVIIWIVFVADFFSFSVAGFFLPQILAEKGAQQDLPLSRVYLDYVPVYAPGIPAVLLAACLVEVPRLGRQWAMVASSALMGVALFLYTQVTTQAGFVGLNAMEYFFQSMFNAILYAFVPEVYPSSIRGTGSGLASTWGRLASILAPIAGQDLYGQDGGKGINNVLYLGGGVVLACPIALAFLPYDTRGRMAS